MREKNATVLTWVFLVGFQISHDKSNNSNSNRFLWVNEKMPRNTSSTITEEWNKCFHLAWTK